MTPGRRVDGPAGDLDLLDGVGRAGDDRRVSAELHIRGLRLSAFR